VPRSWPTAIFSQFFRRFCFLLALFGLFAERATQLRSDLRFYFSQILPPAASDLVAKTVDEVTRNTGSAKVTFASFWR
jgi:uncharacterized BrkB/YihY/UPF0761 family membrane protein